MFGAKYKMISNTKEQLIYKLPVKIGAKITSNFYLIFGSSGSTIIVYGQVAKVSLSNNISLKSSPYQIKQDSEEFLLSVMEKINTELSNEKNFEEVAFGIVNSGIGLKATIDFAEFQEIVEELFLSDIYVEFKYMLGKGKVKENVKIYKGLGDVQKDLSLNISTVSYLFF